MKLNKKIFAGAFIIGAVISNILFYKSAINSINEKIDFNNVKF